MPARPVNIQQEQNEAQADPTDLQPTGRRPVGREPACLSSLPRATARGSRPARFRPGADRRASPRSPCWPRAPAPPWSGWFRPNARAPDPGTFVGKGKADEIGTTGPTRWKPTSSSSITTSPPPAAQPRTQVQCRVVDRSADPRHLRPAGRATKASCRSSSPSSSTCPPASVRAGPTSNARRRHRPARPRREAARNRPPSAGRAGQAAQVQAGHAGAPARRCGAGPGAPRRADHLAGRLYQRRQVDAVQRADQGRRLRRRPALRPSTPPRGSFRRGEAGNVVLSDTVGFIRDLPHSLVALSCAP